MAVSREGRLWAVWYAGITPAEDTNNYVVLSTSGDNGATWEEVLQLIPMAPGLSGLMIRKYGQTLTGSFGYFGHSIFSL